MLLVLFLSLRPIGGKRIGGNFVHLHSQRKTQPNFYFIHSYLLDLCGMLKVEFPIVSSLCESVTHL